MALNLRDQGVISLDEKAPYAPSMYREPIPVLTTAVAIGLIDTFLGRESADHYVSGARARLVKHQDLFWMALLCVSVFCATYLLTSSRLLGFLSVGLMHIDIGPFASTGPRGFGLDSMMSDVAAAAMLTAATALLVAAWRNRRISAFVSAGLAFGLVALIKAAFLYVFVGLLVALLCLALLGRSDLRRGIAGIGALAVAFAVAVVPWMARNYFTLGDFQLSERGGIVLLVRAMKNEMTADEYKGAWYVWAPERLRPMIGAGLEFSERDLQRGGRLQRLNRTAQADFHDDDVAAELAGAPEKAISFYRKARAERVKLARLAEPDAASPTTNVEAALTERALTMIAENPARHLATTPLFLWRGAFFAFPMLTMALLYALWRREFALGVLALPAFGLVLFYALFSHFIGRYSVPASPVAVACLVVLGKSAVEALRGALWVRAISWRPIAGAQPPRRRASG